MKKIGFSILLLILVVGAVGIMIMRNFSRESLTGVDPIIFSCYHSDSEGFVNGGAIYSYNVEKKEKKNIGNIALDRISYDGERFNWCTKFIP